MANLQASKNQTVPCPDHASVSSCNRAKHGTQRGCLLTGLLELTDIIVDELHFFLRLFDMLLELLLSYVETFNIESHFEGVVSVIKGVSYHMIDGLGRDGHQRWSNLDGEMAWKLMVGLLTDSGNYPLLRKIFFVGNRFDLLDHSHGATRDYHERRYDQFLMAFQRLRSLVLFLRMKEGSGLEDIDAFELLAHVFCHDLHTAFEDAVVRKWYLHILCAHLPDLLRRYGSIWRFSCSALERMNGRHSKQLTSAILLTNSSSQLLHRHLLQIYFDFFRTEKREKRKYPTNRKPSPHIQQNQKKITLDHHTGCTIKAKKKRKLKK